MPRLAPRRRRSYAELQAPRDQYHADGEPLLMDLLRKTLTKRKVHWGENAYGIFFALQAPDFPVFLHKFVTFVDDSYGTGWDIARTEAKPWGDEDIFERHLGTSKRHGRHYHLELLLT